MTALLDVADVSKLFPVWPLARRSALACIAGETPASWMRPICTAGETTVKFIAVIFCGPRPLVRAAFTVALTLLAVSISSSVWQIPSTMEPLAGKRA